MIPDGPDRWIDLAGDLHIIRASEVFYWRDATAIGVAAVAEAIGGRRWSFGRAAQARSGLTTRRMPALALGERMAGRRIDVLTAASGIPGKRCSGAIVTSCGWSRTIARRLGSWFWFGRMRNER